MAFESANPKGLNTLIASLIRFIKMAVEKGDDNYSCLLDSDSKKKARDELNEIESDRACAVQTLRKWLLDQDAWLTAPTDFQFLLRFLRVRKFSQVGAQLSLEKFFSNYTNVPEWFTDLDPNDENMRKILRTGYVFSPPKLDKEGRRLIIHRLGQLDEGILKDDLVHTFRALALVANWWAYDENTQVNGVIVLVDWTGVTLRHANTFYTREHTKKMFYFLEHSLPMRSKGLNMYNEPPFFNAVFAIVSPFLKEKTRQRITIHGKNMTSVYKKIDQSILPTEYLPDDYKGPNSGTIAQIVDDMIKDMESPEFSAYIKDLSSSKYKVDLSQKPQTEEAPATYRKFNLD